MKNPIKVSIIMPSLNVVKYIDECILSALNQTLPEKEIICVDAGSTDGTWEKLVYYANNPKYKDTITLLHSHIKSYGYQVNRGIDVASGEYIAVLETDDYVNTDMYKQLYNIAVTMKADFVKADYDTFTTYRENERIFNHISFFKNASPKYGKVINPRKDMYLYTNDHTIWRGIYNRQFLRKNQIRLNESNGAAFQDIAFAQLVFSCAERVVYSERSFYRYRIDRAQSSINSIHGLKYSYWEFSWLLENNDLRKKIVYFDGIFSCLVQTFCFELVKVLRATEYHVNSKFIKPYYIWFKSQIENAVRTNLLTIDLYQLYPQLSLILENINEFSLKLKTEDLYIKDQEIKLLNIAREKDVILFGIGTYGKYLLDLLYRHSVNILAVCDNNDALWGTQKYNLSIYSPSDCVKKYSNAIYIIANKVYGNEMRKQLLDLGIEKKHIYIYDTKSNI